MHIDVIRLSDAASQAIDEVAAEANKAITQLKHEKRAAEKQRDELLAALERFMDSHEECTDFDGFAAQIVSMDDYHEAQEAVARVKGGAA